MLLRVEFVVFPSSLCFLLTLLMAYVLFPGESDKIKVKQQMFQNIFNYIQGYVYRTSISNKKGGIIMILFT